MTWVDIILFLLLVGIIFICFSVGLIRVASVLFGMYLGLQVAAIFYRLFGGLTSDKGSASSIQTNEIIWFGILWVVATIILALVVISFTKSYSLPEKWGNIDQVGGLALGIIAGVFGILIIAFVVRNTLNLAWIAAGRPNNYLYAIVSGFQGSLLMNVFKGLKVLFLNVLSPWIPGDIPIFNEI